MDDGIVERRRQVLQGDIATGTTRHLGTDVHLPRLAERYDVLRHRVLRETVVTEGNQVGLLWNEMHSTVFVDKANGYHIVALAEQSFGQVIATRRVLIVGMSHLAPVDVGDILVEERAEQQPGRLAGMGLVYLYVLTAPYGAAATPLPAVLVDGLPLAVIEVGGRPPPNSPPILGGGRGG
jgi:hypothetical protein